MLAHIPPKARPVCPCAVMVAVAVAVVVGGAAAGAQTPPGSTPASFVGRQVCVPCHKREVELYTGSHHDLAMQPADASTVRGNFDNATFTYGAVMSTFFKKDGGFFVRTDGPDGQLHEYRIAYTFGVDPLQQYLIEFPGGRLQALSVCWDTRPKDQGGQRWFHLYPGEVVDAKDILHWTGPYQNWNHMCAACHSTDLKKNYRAAADRFETSWSEIDVSCEACHGPASRHVAWADAKKKGANVPADPAKGLVVDFTEGAPVSWTQYWENGTAKRSRPRQSHVEVETCGRCHARRGDVSEDAPHGQPLLDTYRTALLEPTLYEDDGQIKDEVYEYGSFLQSKMYAAGVTCSNCHDPHSLKPAAGNALCARCHLPAKFDTPAHHFHRAGTPGSHCPECHMPTRNYMVVHARHDHSLRIPRPDLTVQLGTPNACAQPACHATRPAEWAARAAAKWWGPERARRAHYGETLHEGRGNLPGADRALASLADDRSKPAIVRATAVDLLGASLGPRTVTTVEHALSDPDPLVRMAGVAALRHADPRLRARWLAPLLNDPVRTVRIDVGRALAGAPNADLAPEQQAAARRALEEYRQAQLVDADRAEAHLNLGALHAELGEYAAAEREYRTAIKLSPRFPATYVNLADLYRQQGRDDLAEPVLRDGLGVAPNDANLLEALGLLLVRQKRLPDALPLLERAASMAPAEAHYAYVYAVGLYAAGRTDQATTVLKDARARHPGDVEILQALVMYSRDAGDLAAARTYARDLVKLVPDAPAAQQLLKELETVER